MALNGIFNKKYFKIMMLLKVNPYVKHGSIQPSSVRCKYYLGLYVCPFILEYFLWIMVRGLIMLEALSYYLRKCD